MNFIKYIFITPAIILCIILPLKSEENHDEKDLMDSYRIEKAKHEALLQHEFLLNSQKRILRSEAFEEERDGLNNLFNYFVTITFDDDKKCNSFDFEDTKKKLLQSFNNYQKRYDRKNQSWFTYNG